MLRFSSAKFVQLRSSFPIWLGAAVCSLLACGGSDGAGGAASVAGAANTAGSAHATNGGAANGGAPSAGAASAGAADAGRESGGALEAGAPAGGRAGAVNGSAGASAGSSGNAATGGAGGSGSGFPDPSSFACNAMLGVSVTGDWYNAGFETGLDGDKWQLKWRTQTFVEQWADPKNDIWAQAFVSGCADGAANPDRVIFTGVNWTFTTAGEWETQLTAVVENLKAKYSALKEIDLMTMLRAPGNQLCGNPDVAATHEQVVAPFIDQAILAVVAKYPTLVRAAPPFFAPDCAVFLPDSPHFATGKAALVAKVMRDYYATH